MGRFALILLLVLLSVSFGLAQEKDPTTRYYESLKDGLTLEDLRILGPMTSEQERGALRLLEHYQSAPIRRLNECGSNLKNLGTAMEMWATDHNGEYPDNLAALNNAYLLAAPSCPTTDHRTYKLERTGNNFEISCPGNHEEVGVEPPRYDETTGLHWKKGTSPTWVLKSLKVEEPRSQYDSPVYDEVWADGKTTFERRSQHIEGRHQALRADGTPSTEVLEAVRAMDAYFRPKPLISEDYLDHLYELLGPALTGMAIFIYVADPEYADASLRL